jgi:membrane-anchored glycerophosphoryl diester phosphodiesterase (GDPDase)
MESQIQYNNHVNTDFEVRMLLLTILIISLLFMIYIVFVKLSVRKYAKIDRETGHISTNSCIVRRRRSASY